MTSTYLASSSLRRWVDRLPAVISSSSWSLGNDIWSPGGTAASVAVMRSRAAAWMTGSSSMSARLSHGQQEVRGTHKERPAAADGHHQVVRRCPEERGDRTDDQQDDAQHELALRVPQGRAQDVEDAGHER